MSIISPYNINAQVEPLIIVLVGVHALDSFVGFQGCFTVLGTYLGAVADVVHIKSAWWRENGRVFTAEFSRCQARWNWILAM